MGATSSTIGMIPRENTGSVKELTMLSLYSPSSPFSKISSPEKKSTSSKKDDTLDELDIDMFYIKSDKKRSQSSREYTKKPSTFFSHRKSRNCETRISKLKITKNTKCVIDDKLVRQDIGALEHNFFYSFLMAKVMCENFNSIYDTKIHGFDTRNLRSEICGKRSLLFVFQTKEYVFGFYQKDMIPLVKSNEPTQVTSEETFLFFMKRELECPFLITKRDQKKTNFSLYANDSTTLISCYSAFWLDTNGNLSFNPHMKDSYNIKLESYSHSHLSSSINNQFCERMLVLKCL
ncbi:hypothetical protein EIN_270500 [Entamoeba invadens IP1]|uniref:TLDc domain-containing protein n=1 Tax=Entamoeba invadens IP1 TaxID=370355 RepID=L7FQ77_ENTIV|nr:hypothetical protein EIN_270500 [Entamoeba invadens IP1]ELP92819.1 hypothetical protein EIN_270500 [Entamoeba invadens IP1]|eukprot:XP_004259590.1 hypothetical protein EIN_270500 [Entamoeba invadens IP1]